MGRDFPRKDEGVAPSDELVERVLELADRCGRQDLRERLTTARRRTADPNIRVPVVGEAGQGKSRLINALVGAPVCPVDEDVVAAAPIVVRHGAVPKAVLLWTPAAGGGPAGDGTYESEPVPLAEFVARIAADGDAQAAARVVRGEVELPRTLLSGGLQLVDTPGVGGAGGTRSLATIDLLPSARAVVFTSDASQAFTATEMTFLRQVLALCPHVVCAVTKTDAHGSWRRIVELDREHLAAEGLDLPVLPVSAGLALLALQRQDRDLYEESGLSALADHLRHRVVDRAESLAQASLLHDLTTITEHLALAQRTELAALEDPDSGRARASALETARAEAEDLKRRSSRWQQVLADGVTDLMSDIDYDLRDRARVVVREAEDAIDAQDPGANWDDLTEWLDERVAQAVADSYVWAGQRSEWLATRVIEQFAEDGGTALPELFVADVDEVLGTLVDVADIDRGSLTLRERVLIGLKGSYTGVLMTGLATSLMGLAIINPVSLAAGAVIGTKAYRDDQAARRHRRQAEAKAVVRRHLDEVVFQVGKQLKDRLRMVQRTLRDLIADTAEEMSRSAADAVRAASRAAKVATAEREARIRQVRQELARVERLAQDIAGAAAPAAAPAATGRGAG
jgi:Dynamin family